MTNQSQYHTLCSCANPVFMWNESLFPKLWACSFFLFYLQVFFANFVVVVVVVSTRQIIWLPVLLALWAFIVQMWQCSQIATITLTCHNFQSFCYSLVLQPCHLKHPLPREQWTAWENNQCWKMLWLKRKASPKSNNSSGTHVLMD